MLWPKRERCVKPRSALLLLAGWRRDQLLELVPCIRQPRKIAGERLPCALAVAAGRPYVGFGSRLLLLWPLLRQRHFRRVALHRSLQLLLLLGGKGGRDGAAPLILE